MMTDTALNKNYLKPIMHCFYLFHEEELEGLVMQFLFRRASRGELAEGAIHTLERIVNNQSLVNYNARQLDG